MKSIVKQESVERLPFEQLPKESDKAFAAFRGFTLDMGPQRSLSLVGKKLGKSKTMMEQWSRKFDWVSRVQAYTAHLAEAERKAIEGLAIARAVEWEKTHEPVRREAWREAELTIAMVRRAREEWMAKGRLPGWEGMARMLELAFKLKQFAAGMPSEIKEVNTHVSGTIDVEWEIALRKAYGQVAPVGDQATPPVTVAPAGVRETAAVVDVEEVRPPEVGGQEPEVGSAE